MALRGDLVATADNPGIFSRAVLTELGEEFLETRVQLALDPIAVEAQRNIARRGHASVYPEAAFPASRASQGYAPRPTPREKKGRPTGASLLPKLNNLRRLSGRLRLLGAFLLDLLDLVEQVVGLLLQTCSLVRGFHHVCLAPINEAEVAHRVVVVRFDLESLLQSGNAFIHKRAAFGNGFRAHGGVDRIRVLHLLLQVLLFGRRPHFAAYARPARPLHHPSPGLNG